MKSILLKYGGGEPLLVPDLHKYLYEARKEFPESELIIGTNGLLIHRISDEVLTGIRKTRAAMAISLYPPTVTKMNEIREFLARNGIYARFPVQTQISHFVKKYTINKINPNREIWNDCPSKYCLTMMNGHISQCYLPICSHHFNEFFKKNAFDTNGDLLDLYSPSLTKESFIKYLRAPLQSCRYCVPGKLELWRVAPNDTVMEDWVFT